MSSWAIVTVVAIAVWGLVQIIRARHGVTRDRYGNESQAPSGPDPEAQREIAELRERVKVLEQITVEGREAKAIAEQIEQLRDR